MVEKGSVINAVVEQHMCVGCGVCTTQNSVLQMMWNDEGFLVPHKRKDGVLGSELKVCPFNPSPKSEVRTEDELSKIFLTTATRSHARVGLYNDFYIGYSNQYRETSSSGGLATYIADQLLRNKIVDAVAYVVAIDGNGKDRFDFKLIESVDELCQGARTKYYPVTYASILGRIRSYSGTVAISGVGCFVKGIRLLQYYDPIFREKIKFVTGIICGGLKSSFFSDFLAQKAGCYSGYARPEFRVKDFDSTANDYSFACQSVPEKHSYSIKMRSVGDMWGTGYFKCKACDFCDDVTTELADISLGDAWLPEVAQDGKGNNVIVTRSSIADQIIQEGISNGDLHVGQLSKRDFLRSQSGSFNHRQKALGFRIKESKNSFIPPKRHDSERIKWGFKIVQRQRARVRQASLNNWKESRDTIVFDRMMIPSLHRLRMYTELYHIDRLPGRIIRKLRNYVK